MKKRIQRQNIEVFSLSFLDVVSCGFGAIILLLVISKISQPLMIEESTVEKKQLLLESKNNLTILQNKIKVTHNKLRKIQQQIDVNKSEFNKDKLILAKTTYDFKDLNKYLKTQTIIKKQLSLAQQKLTDEMKRLQRIKPVINKENTVGGISVNSEYIIFIIDTSGSMKNFAWSLVRKKMKEILQIHPNVKGIQVMNDMGDYMFSQYAGRWISDSPARRRAILKHLLSWEPFSNSSPEEGITKAIKHFYATDKKISLYIFGDDFSRGAIQSLIDTVARLNKKNQSGESRVRINAVGFPVLFNHPGTEENIARFSALMRNLTEKNNGSFVGLTHLK